MSLHDEIAAPFRLRILPTARYSAMRWILTKPVRLTAVITNWPFHRQRFELSATRDRRAYDIEDVPISTVAANAVSS